MRITALAALVAVAGLATLLTHRRAAAGPNDGDQAGVRAAVELYFQGHATGNGDFWRRAFHPEAKLFWVKDGAFAQRTLAEFIGGAAGKPADDEAKRTRKITLIDVTGDSAVAKVELDYPAIKFTDYLSLLKLDGKWVIVNKIFHRVNRPAAPAVRSP